MFKEKTISELSVSLMNLTPIFLSSFGLGMAFGGYIPLISLWLNTLDISFSGIGLITGASSVGVIISAYFGPRVVAKIGYLKGAMYGIFIASIAGVLFRFCKTEEMWILLRILAGLGFGLHWVISEAWLGQLVSKRNRTRAMSFYVVSMALGFSAGPIIIWITEISSLVPFFLIGGLQTISVIPLVWLRNVQPKQGTEFRKSPFFLIKAGPTIAAGCILVGLIDLSLISLLPVLVSRIPESVSSLAYLLPIFGGIGTVFMQYPLVILSEKFGNRQTAYLVTTLGMFSCALIPFFLKSALIALTLTFLGSGLVYFMYTISLALLSERFKGTKLISANASFIILFELSNLIGPIVAGGFLDKSIKLGLSFFIISIGTLYIFIARIRDFQRNKNKFRI
jgi:MFS family permease